jgi:hypothetical protein
MVKIRILLLLLIFCNTPLAYAETSDSPQSVCESLNKAKREKTIINDKFVEEISENFLAWKNVKTIYLNAKISQIKEKSPHNPKLINIIVRMTEGKDYLSYYLSDGDSTPLCVLLFSNKLDTPPFLFIGQPLSVFHKKFGFNQDVDVLTINTVEGADFVKLLFLNGKLHTIIYKLENLD